ncbi:MAG: cupin domain-containing protein [Propionibacteriaceae bacterium]|nr:cupin domain-containing protein [Propionibacteriaceae bacterium]
MDQRCVIVRTAGDYQGKQGLTYFEGISKASAGSQALCLHLLTIPPGGRAKAHLHEAHETAISVLSGEAEVWFAERLADHATVRSGEFMDIPPGVPHLPMNRSGSPYSAVIARTDPNEQESVVLLPDLDSVPDQQHG